MHAPNGGGLPWSYAHETRDRHRNLFFKEAAAIRKYKKVKKKVKGKRLIA
jgi:hypothetical protein